ncbi:unnamed protein product [Parascedosporium putredinis]|uniref:Eukaryotic translation initiation factor 5B n=1 Tax=Parascedosporium putredinis TaxID=1442378 RepID=A0A9P1H7S1_9PEZI|nr:unnamed protein product [Parascedosporium putredinis]CAI7998928.1 unnamed protein product [Parascedosporium putredinis]
MGVTELVHGLPALITLDVEYGAPLRNVWVFPDFEFQGQGGFIVLLSLHNRSLLAEVSIDLNDVRETELPNPCIDTTSRTLAAALISGRLYALTQAHSLEIVNLDLLKNQDSYTTGHRLIEKRMRPTTHMTDIGSASNSSGAWPITLISDRECGIVGVWIPRGGEDGDIEVVLEAELPASVRRFQKGTPDQLGGDQNLGSPDMGEFQVQPRMPKFLKLIQNVADSHYRVTLQVSSDQLEEISEPNPVPKLQLHVNGDILYWCFQSRNLETLFRNQKESQLFMRYLDELDGVLFLLYSGKKKKIPAHLALIQKQQEELRRKQEEEAQRLAQERAKIEEDELKYAEEQKRKEEQKALKKQKEKEKIEQLKKEGKFLTKAQREEKARNERKLQQMIAAGVKERAEADAAKATADSDVEDDWEAAAASDGEIKESWDVDTDEENVSPEPANGEASSSEEDEAATQKQLAELQRKKEARGITQQIGATYFPAEAIKQKTAVVNKDGAFELKVPGLLIIDTPGHESFSNLRSRGSSLCNIAILVVDIMHGLEAQTLESMKLLRDRKTPFIVALNKIDRLYGWKKVDNNGFQESLSLQSRGVQNEFKNRLQETKLAFAEQGFNAELYYENKSMAKNVSLIPTSAHTGEGVPDLLKLIVELTQERMVGSLMYLSEVQATVLEVKAIEGFGMTIDVILTNGILREGDRIIICGVEGVIKTNIRALLTPAPMRELRLKSAYIHNKEVKAAMGIKISASGLEGAIAGSRLLVVGPDDDESDLEDEVESDLALLFSRVEKNGKGVSVQASTLGSLEALLDFLKSCKIPVANVGIGPVYKRDVMQCGIMLERAPDYAVMLCFDVKVDKEAQAYAEDNGIKIFTADIIYHLFDAFTKHMDELLEKKKEESKLLAVFPCVLNPVAIFNKTTPIVVGVDVVEGQLRLNTPIAVVKTNPTTNTKEIIQIGRV